MKTSIAFTIVAMIFAACGQPATSGAGPTPPSTTLLGSEVADGHPPEDTIVGCPGGPTFPISALDDVRPIEEVEIEGLDAAFASFLETEEGAFWPGAGWRLLHRTDDELIAVNLSEEHGLAFMTFEFGSDGVQWSGASSPADCPLTVPTPDHLHTVNWELDPEREAPNPDSTQVHLLLTERECVSGIEIGDRLVGPDIHYGPEEVRIGFAATPPTGDAFNCQGNPSTPITIDLIEPLGERSLVDLFSVPGDLRDYLD